MSNIEQLEAELTKTKETLEKVLDALYAAHAWDEMVEEAIGEDDIPRPTWSNDYVEKVINPRNEALKLRGIPNRRSER